MYCSPMGVFRLSRYRITIRAYRDTNILKFLTTRNSIYIYLCRDPVTYYLTLKNHIIDATETNLLKNCGFVAEFNINIGTYTDIYTEFIITPVKVIDIKVPNPKYLARICRSENALIENLILYTRKNLYINKSSYIFYRNLLKYHKEVFERLSTIKDIKAYIE